MGILSWLKKVNLHDDPGNGEPSLEFDAGDEYFRGLNMKEALDAHMEWIQRFESLIKGEINEPIQFTDVALDDRCVLGQWINSHAKKAYANTAEYETLKTVHAHFHSTAGEVVNCLASSDMQKAREKLKAVRTESSRVQLALARLYAAQN